MQACVRHFVFITLGITLANVVSVFRTVAAVSQYHCSLGLHGHGVLSWALAHTLIKASSDTSQHALEVGSGYVLFTYKHGILKYEIYATILILKCWHTFGNYYTVNISKGFTRSMCWYSLLRKIVNICCE